MIEQQLSEARTSSYALLDQSAAQINEVLLKLADALVANAKQIVEANALDLSKMDSSDPRYYNYPSQSSIFGHQTGATFSDDNPHACAIM